MTIVLIIVFKITNHAIKISQHVTKQQAFKINKSANMKRLDRNNVQRPQHSSLVQNSTNIFSTKTQRHNDSAHVTDNNHDSTYTLHIAITSKAIQKCLC